MRRVSFAVLSIPRPFLALCALVALSAGAGLWLSTGPSTFPVAAQTSDGGSGPIVARVGHPAPDFTLRDVDGRAHALSAYRGRPVLVYFWATWCHYCHEALPELVNLKQAHQGAGFEILAVNILEGPDKVRAYQMERQLPFPLLLDPDAAVSDAYLVRATPTYALIDRDGLLNHLFVGTPRRGAIQARLLPLLETAKED